MAENPPSSSWPVSRRAWTLREIAERVCHVDAYAEEVGRLR
jgi:hypothetical protein